MDHSPEGQEVKKEKQLSLPTAIVIAAVIIAGALFGSRITTKNTQANVSSVTSAIADVSSSDFIHGNENAPLTLIEYADFSCGYCALYHPTLKRIVEEYAGKVKWVYRHLPIFNKPAAIASECVGRLLGDEAFFLYADTLYVHQKSINGEFMKQEALKLGLSESSYDACTTDPELSDEISREFSVVRILAGFNATPYTVLVDKEGKHHQFSGALPYEDLKSLIDTMLIK